MKKFLLVAATLGVAAVTSFTQERAANACGGCFHPPEENPTVVTDHRMILTIAQGQSTLYDQVSYQGNPSSFAWVLPIVGTVDVGLSAKIVFDTLDGLTQTRVIAPPQNCPAAPVCRNQPLSPSAGSVQDAGASEGDVTVTKEQVVGPYLTVQLHADNGDSLQKWLTDNGFSIPPDIAPVINQYVAEHFDFLALKLIPGAGIQDMRPVRVTTKAANAVLPLRMIAAGTGATVGITLYTIAEGRYEAQNFPNFTIAADELSWDWTNQRSNYAELRATKEAALGGKGWETESASLLLPQTVQSAVTNSGYYGGGYNYPDSGTDDPEEAAARLNYDPVKDDQGTITKTAVQVRDEDLAALFYGVPSATSRVTRMRSDLAHAALNADLVMIASANQSYLDPTRQVTKEQNEPLCTIYNGCDAVGTAPRSEAAAQSNGGNESFGCSTSKLERSSPLAAIGMGLGYVAFSLLRARRRSAR